MMVASAALDPAEKPPMIGFFPGLCHRASPVANDAAMIRFVVEKRQTDPTQVLRLLMRKRDPGPDPRMNEQVASEGRRIDEARKELGMLFRDRLTEELQGRSAP